MKKNNFFKLALALLIAMFSLGKSNAQSFVNESFANKIGKNFIELKTGKSDVQLDVFHVENDSEGNPALYIFNVEGGGFVIVSASKNLNPIMAYSDRNSYEGEIPETARYFIDNYRENVEYYNKVNRAADDNVAVMWKSLEDNVLPAAKNTNVVDPLIQTRWNQDCYYNALAPSTGGGWWGGGPCGHCYAGCVACAMSQVMKFWNHPAQGRGSHSYVHHEYGTQSANFGATTYDWDNMPNEIWNDNIAIATLMYHCGVSVNMDFGPDGSGAQSHDVENAMRKYFGYCSATYKERSQYTEDEWIAMLKSDLDKGHPMYFSGSGEPGGHAIVCDGYDERDFFSFNLGWSGSGNGFYDINDVAGFNQNEAVVMNIVPLAINSDANGIIYVSADGTGDGSSWDNATKHLEFASSVATEVSNQIWVKAGTYYGDMENNNGAFTIYDNNRIYGGFTGDEPADFDLADRDLEANPTILDGMNQRRVVFQSDHFQNAAYSIWDGFTIKNGNSGAGAGAYLCSNSRFVNCKFQNNNATGFGGGVYVISAYYENASVKFENCTFENNHGSMGGGICDMLGITLLNCDFRNNSANTKGGAYYVYTNKQPKMTNCIFAKNSAKEAGAIYNRGKFTMINCDVVDNEAAETCGGLHNDNHYSRIYNSIFWGNKANDAANQIDGDSKFYYCAVQGGFEGEHMIAVDDPCFTDAENGDYSLTANSPLINRGDKSVTGVAGPDILGNQRVVGAQIDLGAIEYQGTAGLEEVVGNSFMVYPNPVNDVINIELGDRKADVEIFNCLGQVVKRLAGMSGTVQMNVSDLNAGIYFINIGDKVEKVVKR